jgi:D-beta-D-heptose 7-phosphate kinase/D-beta-D-heptose 1-phosphate adenosyltransferase
MIIFTNGVFDLLHVGHLDFLRKIYGEKFNYPDPKIVVGINSDESVRRLKGPSRPIIPQNHRKMMLEALSIVDKVYIFEEDTAVELIRKLSPAVYFKGWDYFGKPKCPEQEFVESYGGEVRLAMPPLPSLGVMHTTDIINKIKAGG